VVRRVLLEEEPVIDKRAVVYEEVVIGKSLVPETHQVTADVRREELRIDNPDQATDVTLGTAHQHESVVVVFAYPNRADGETIAVSCLAQP
jgi:stress response protein YsnF